MALMRSYNRVTLTPRNAILILFDLLKDRDLDNHHITKGNTKLWPL